MSASTRRYAWGVAALLVVSGAAWQGTRDTSSPVQDTVAPQADPQSVAVAEPGEPEAAPEISPVEDAQPDLAAAPPAIDPAMPVIDSATPVIEPAPVPVIRPSLDTFRIEADGQMVLAGRAAPGAVLDILVAGEQAERLTADANGTFFAFLDLAPSEQSRSLTVVADPEGAAIAMAETYLIEPFGVKPAEPPAGPAAVPGDLSALLSPQTPPESQPDASSDASSGEADDAEVMTAEAQPAPIGEDVSVVSEAIEEIFGATAAPVGQSPEVPQPAAPAPVTAAPAPPKVLVADPDGVRVLSGGSAPQVQIGVALDTITYDPTGEVLLAGRASTDGFVQVYIDNRPISTSRITADLNWRTDLPDIDTGIYTLRIDEVDDTGQVVSRIETPFKREEPDVVAAVMAEETADQDFEVAVKAVQPGATLWAIAQEQYGDGILYVAVFEANSDLIRDPDLIYPGQIFVLPELDAAAEE